MQSGGDCLVVYIANDITALPRHLGGTNIIDTEVVSGSKRTAFLVGGGDSSNYRLGSSVGERPSRIREVPGSIPGLAYPSSSYMNAMLQT